MRKNLLRLSALIPVLILSGCIFTATPVQGPVAITLGQNQIFKITGYGSVQWYLDNVALTGQTAKSYTYQSNTYGVGSHVLKVVTSFGSIPIDWKKWTITVTAASTKVAVPAATNCEDVEAVGLVCAAIPECNDTVEEGEVIRQDPVAGAMVEPNTTVNLVLSSGACTDEVEVPTAQSCTDVTNAGLVCSTTTACSNTAASGAVISQSPVAGTMVAPGSTVELTLSTGACPVTVPTAQSCTDITNAGLVCSSSTECSDTVASGKLISQSPAAGTGVPAGSTVNLVFSSGPCPVMVPAATSCADITKVGLVCATTTKCSDTVSAGGIISQSPISGTMVQPGSTVTLTLASGACTVSVTTPENVQATDVLLTSVSDPLLNNNLDDRVRVTWDAVSAATYYEVYRSNTATGTYTLIGKVDAPTTSYDDVQTETLTLPTLAATYTQADLTAYDNSFHAAVSNFKKVRYYKVKAYNATSQSSLSAYDAGQMDYTIKEFEQIAGVVVALPNARLSFSVPTTAAELMSGFNLTDYDPCGSGNMNWKLSVALLYGTGTFTTTYTNYIDSLSYNTASGSTDCSAGRQMIVNGTIKGTIGISSGSGTMTGSLTFTGNVCGKISNISIPVTNYSVGIGTCTVQYNGQQESSTF